MRDDQTLAYSTSEYGFYEAAINLLEGVSSREKGGGGIGNFQQTSEDEEVSSPSDDAQLHRVDLESFKVPPKNLFFSSFKARQKVYKAVSNDQAFLSLYETFIKEVIIPSLREHVISNGGAGDELTTTYHYQYPPTLRIQPGPSAEYGPKHIDYSYGVSHRTTDRAALKPSISPIPHLFVCLPPPLFHAASVWGGQLLDAYYGLREDARDFTYRSKRQAKRREWG
jgi:hypothetical protein